MNDLHPDQDPQKYEAPAIVRLGSVDELTRSAPDSDSITLDS